MLLKRIIGIGDFDNYTRIISIEIEKHRNSLLIGAGNFFLEYSIKDMQHPENGGSNEIDGKGKLYVDVVIYRDVHMCNVRGAASFVLIPPLDKNDHNWLIQVKINGKDYYKTLINKETSLLDDVTHSIDIMMNALEDIMKRSSEEERLAKLITPSGEVMEPPDEEDRSGLISKAINYLSSLGKKERLHIKEILKILSS